MSLMSHLPIAPILLPFFAAVVMLLPWFNQKLYRQRILASATNLLMLLAAIALLVSVKDNGQLFYALGDWEAPYGIVLVADGFSALLILLSAILGLSAHCFACAQEDKNGEFFHPLFLFQVMGINGAFLTGDAFNLFVFFEILLISSYALTIHGGGKARTQANIHYVFLNLIGSALFLIALGTLYGTLGTLNFADMAARAAELDSSMALVAKSGAMLLLAVFGLKAAILPLHFWLPRAYSSTSTPVAALFAIMTKVGIYSIWRVHGVMFGDGAGELANIALPWLWPIAIFTITFGVVAAVASQSLRVLTSNLVVISVGTLLITIYLNSDEAATAGIYYLLHSTISCAAMFLLAGLVQNQRGKAEDRFVQARSMPQSGLLSALFAILAIALIGMPPLSGFIGKALVLKSAAMNEHVGWIYTAILVAGLFALIGLSRAGTCLFWNNRGDNPTSERAHPAQLVAIGLLIACLPLMVIFAGELTAYTELAAQHLRQGVSVEQINLGVSR